MVARMKTVSCLPLFAILIASAACDKTTPATADAAPTASVMASSVVADAATPMMDGGAKKAHGQNRGGMFGATAMLFQAADDADLKPEQDDKIEKINDGLHDGKGMHAAGDGGVANEAKALHEDLGAQVKAGKIEMAKLKPHYDAIEKGEQERLDKEAEATNSLYAALEPAQRKTIAEDAKVKETKRGERMAKMEQNKPDGGPPSELKKHAERLTKDLGLDADQQKKLDAIVTKDVPKDAKAMFEDMKKRNDAVFDAFQKDTFDAKKLDAYKATKEMRSGMEKEATFLGQLVAFLKPDQREKLAKQLESSGNRGMMNPHGNFGGGDHGGGGGDGRPHMMPLEDMEK